MHLIQRRKYTKPPAGRKAKERLGRLEPDEGSPATGGKRSIFLERYSPLE